MAARLGVLLAGCLLAAACAIAPMPPADAQVGAQTGAQEAAQAGAVRIHATPLLRADGPAAAPAIGRLRWRGGIAMTADAARFGGWSDLHVSPDGRRLASISDVGGWLRAVIDYDADGDLAGLSQARIGRLLATDGRPLAGKARADAEALARAPDGWLVAFERDHRLWRYGRLDGTPVPVEGPAEMGRQPANGGIESLAVLADGRVVALSEHLRPEPGAVTGWIGTPRPAGGYAWARFAYAAPADFAPTGLAQLPDGGLVVLERAFDLLRGVRCRVTHFEAAALAAGATVQPRELARLAAPDPVDNLEGIAATRGPRGETLIWLMSDDNFNPLQRNILLQFELLPRLPG